jgi:hypothetical protein
MEKPLAQHIQPDRIPLDLQAYEKVGGYTAVRQALQMPPADITKLVKGANLKGRGGVGFNTGQKWSFVPMGDDAPTPKYLICNADEMEPGIAELVPEPYVGVGKTAVAHLNLDEGQPVQIILGETILVLPCHPMSSLPDGVVALPRGLPGLPTLPLPAWVELEKVQ